MFLLMYQTNFLAGQPTFPQPTDCLPMSILFRAKFEPTTTQASFFCFTTETIWVQLR